MKISAFPECPEGIAEVEVSAEKGSYDTNPTNGTFSLSWTPDTVVLSADRIGDGMGGDIKVELPLTSSARESLHKALAEWKAAFAK